MSIADKENADATASDNTIDSKQNGQHNQKQTISVMTYNIHSCVGSDAQYSVDRIAEVIRESNADIVCLQEVELNTAEQTTRTWSHPHGDDQTARIAQLAGYDHYEFAPAISCKADVVAGTEVYGEVSGNHGQFGVSLLSKWPIVHHRILAFAPYRTKTPRNVLACQIRVSDGTDSERAPVWVLSTHLGCHYRGSEQLQQAHELKELVEELLKASPDTTLILAGDFNSIRWYSSVKMMKAVLMEANRRPQGTFPAMGKFLRPGTFQLDYIFHSPNVICTDTHVQRKGAIASDHLALSAKLLI